MTEHRETYAEAVARRKRERDRELADKLAELGVTHHEASLFHVVSYGMTYAPSELARVAASDSYNLGGPATEADTQAALAACLAKGWLQVIDEAALAEIAADLRAGHFLGPIYGLPPVGGVDFTPAGAALWQRIFPRSDDTEAFAFIDVVHEKTARYFRTWAAAVEEIETVRAYDDLVAVSNPIPIGPWRAQWWRRFPDGYRVDIEQRRQWWGCGEGGGETCDLRRAPERCDPVRLRAVLDQHAVALAEWVVLAAVEGWPCRFEDYDIAHLVAAAGQDCGATLTAEECRDGLEGCVRNGWVRVLDQQAIDEIRALLRADSAMLAVPKTAELRWEGCYYLTDPLRPGESVPAPRPDAHRWGEVDFTPAGAALYQTILGEWLGPGWECDLHVEYGYYWEEHRYCETEAGFRGIVPEYVAKGQVVRNTRVVPIGPWCVRWWERFPAGYRLELEIGTP